MAINLIPYKGLVFTAYETVYCYYTMFDPRFSSPGKSCTFFPTRNRLQYFIFTFSEQCFPVFFFLSFLSFFFFSPYSE